MCSSAKNGNLFSTPVALRLRAFTLIELLVVIAIIGILALILIPDTRVKDDGSRLSPYRALKVERPSETVLMADGGQRSGGWAFGYFVLKRSAYDPATAESSIPVSDFYYYGASEDNPGFSARHNDRGNVLFVDSHIESFASYEFKQKHVKVEQPAF